MATTADDRHRKALESEYIVWAGICEDKHGQPWPFSVDDLPAISDAELSVEVKKLKVLGRTPHEG
jgi:hypothetical protein